MRVAGKAHQDIETKLLGMNMEEQKTEFRATGIFLSGFQSIQRDTYIPVKPLTFLYGPNSAGKSSIIDAIGLFQNLANQDDDLFFGKVKRWARRDLDEGGRTVGWATGRLRVGVEFTFPINWKEFLSREILEFKKTDYEKQVHIEWLENLVGKKIQLDVGIQEHTDPLTYRLAIDDAPLFECRLGEQDDGRATWWDANGRSPDDQGYDEDSEIMVDGPMRIYQDHKFWNKNKTIASLSEFAKLNSEPEIGRYVRGNSRCTDLYDVMSPYRGKDSQRSIFDFEVGSEFYKAIHQNSSRLRRNLKIAQRGVQERFALTGEISRVLIPNKRLWSHDEVDELLMSIGAMCRALLELGSRSLANIQVSGSRQILRPSDMTFVADSYFEDTSNEKSRIRSSFVSFARHLAYGDTKNKALDFYHHSPRRDHRVVNQWLLATLPSLRGHKLSVDAFVTSPVPRKKRGFSDVPKFTYHLYLTDAQGRPHEFEDVGSGFSYLLPILMALWNEPWSIVEQPELHLHPAAQCDVADVFIAAKNIGSSAVIESHSENLLLRLLRRVRETNDGTLKNKSLMVCPDDVAIMYFDPQSDGTTLVKRLRISRDGDFIDRWPAGFFEERTKELFGE